jgi:chromosome segregation ATPase
LETTYKTRLSNLQEAVPRLERELAEVRKITEDLYVRRANTAMEKVAILEESKKAELRYIQKKQERNIAITALEEEVDDLKSEIAERDEKLAKYKSSLRTMLALAIKLTGKRIRATGTRVLDLVPALKKTSTRGSHQLLNTVRQSVVIDKNEEQ